MLARRSLDSGAVSDEPLDASADAPRIAIVTTDPAWYSPVDPDRDTAPLLDALHRRGARAEAVVWHDEGVDWAAFDVAVVRSTWDYAERPGDVEPWLDRAGRGTRLLNEPELIRWNLDKRYLAQLAEAGIAVVPTTYHLDPDHLPDALAAHGAYAACDLDAHVVVKPAIGAASRLTGLFRADDPAALALAHAVLAEGNTVMLQPEVPELSAGAEKALYLVDGEVTHAIAKGALLARGGGLLGGVYEERPVVVEANDGERAFAREVLSAVGRVTGVATPLYARIDMVDSAAHGLVLLEAELFEPALNLHLVPHVTELVADAILRRA